MSAHRRLAWALLSVLGGCTFLTSFDPEGQPCDPNALRPESECLSDAGYWCVGGACKKGNRPADVDAGQDSGVVDPRVDAGKDAGLDAGVDAGRDAGIDAGKTDAGCDGGKLDGGC